MPDPNYSRELLHELYVVQGLTARQIADRFGLKTERPVSRRLAQLGIASHSLRESAARSWQGADTRREAQAEWMHAVRHSDAFLNQAESLAKRYRSRPTKGERLMEAALTTLGIRFLFQERIGPFIVDFLLPDIACVLEVDTKHHTIPKIAQRDDEKDRYLRAHGLGVIRVFVQPRCDETMALSDLQAALQSFNLYP